MRTSITAALAAAFATFAVANPSPAKIEARATSSSASASGSALPTVTKKGNAFFAGEDRFYIKGVDYQPGGSSNLADPLADSATCNRDIPMFKKLGLNTIRVYTVDNSKNHDACMSALADAGIYLALDVNTPKYSLNRENVAVSYNADYLQSVFATIDAFAGYSNTLLYFSGNEVLNDTQASTKAAPYVKAVNRDMMQYIGERGYRNIPVGYSAADVSTNQYLMGQYMDCGEDQTRSQFYAINNYEWCDPSSYQQSGWEGLVQQYKNYSGVLFMSEYGCITNTRKFEETKALYQPDMTSVFSGGLVYEYAQEANDYGLVNINGNSVSPVGQQVQYLQSALQSVANINGAGGYQTGNTEAQPCPGQSSNWDTKPFTGSALPAMPSGAQKYMKSGAGKGPGLSGPGSQESGTDTVSTAAAGAGSATQTYGNGPTGGSGSGSSSSAAASHLAMPTTDFTTMFVCVAAVALSFAVGAVAL